MKVKIRRNVFETNSSSTHSLTIVTSEDYKDWQDGKCLYNRWDGEIKTLEEVEKIKETQDHFYEDEWQTYEQYEDDWSLEQYSRTFTTPSGDTMVAFGKFGRDG